MKIRLSHLRKIIQEEVVRVLDESPKKLLKLLPKCEDGTCSHTSVAECWSEAQKHEDLKKYQWEELLDDEKKLIYALGALNKVLFRMSDTGEIDETEKELVSDIVETIHAQVYQPRNIALLVDQFESLAKTVRTVEEFLLVAQDVVESAGETPNSSVAQRHIKKISSLVARIKDKMDSKDFAKIKTGPITVIPFEVLNPGRG